MYRVKLAASKRSETVWADYFKVDCGLLTFRKISPNQGYPVFVKCFAAGSWLTVENIEKD